jgi:hypothetical protein
MRPLPLIIAFITLFTTHLGIFAQSKELTLKTEEDVVLYKVAPSGNNHFLAMYGKALLSKKAKKNVMKYNKDLEPVWKQPIVFTGAELGAYNTFSYTNETTKTTYDYLFGLEQFLQIRPDGSVKEQKTGIPKKEFEKTAAVFTDTLGMNILTLTGDEDFLTGTMNWYTFSHDNLKLTKRKITLPMPPQDEEIQRGLLRKKEIESGWRLNEVTASGLYFYCGTYKNNPNDKSEQIFSNYVVHVDPTGKAGSIISLNHNIKRVKTLAVDFQQDIYPNLAVVSPPINVWYSNKKSRYAVASDNAYAGLKIDAKSQKIYTVTAIRKDSLPAKGMRFVTRIEEFVAYLVFNTYNFEGKKLAESHLKFNLPKLERMDNHEKIAYKIDIIPMSNTEGVVCKLMHNGNGVVWALNSKGEMVEENKIKPNVQKFRATRIYTDVFSAPYFSINDFKNSPYVLKEKSPTYQIFQKLDDKVKKTSTYYSLKDYELMAVWDNKADKIKFYSFTKN